MPLYEEKLFIILHIVGNVTNRTDEKNHKINCFHLSVTETILRVHN